MLVISLILSIIYITRIIYAQPITHKVPSVFFANKKRYFDYSQTLIQGVNIGGWLVLEPYITPSLFESFRKFKESDEGIPVDEYHFCKFQDFSTAKEILIQHYNTFYTENDFAKIAAAGLNLVRIPIGYWGFEKRDSDPYVSGIQEGYLDKAINWSTKYGLKVWVDLHGVPGSQNGFDNSGLRDTIQFQEPENADLTLKVIKYMLRKYSQPQFLDVVIGIELVNEPLGPVIDMNKLRELYQEGYSYVRNTLDTNQMVILHDAFQAPHYWDDFLTLDKGYWGVVMDHHHYQVFSQEEVSRSIEEHIAAACSWKNGPDTEAHWSIAGEWSPALTDCAKWLNGVGIGARYDGTYHKNGQKSYWVGSCEKHNNIAAWSDQRKQDTRRYIEAQLDTFEVTRGWIIWCYKTESAIEWDLSVMLAYGLFPQPLNSRQYPNQCNHKNENK